uniref:HMG box domain-containing protein n=1 Tax=Anopheles atroparvus TaxID=41427 RepID=A0A182IKG6_ANOAO
MPKKKHNAFFYFMLDYKRREEAKGRRFRGMEEVSRLAGPIWQNMDARKRAPFVEQEKQNSAQRSQEKLNAGSAVSLIAKEQTVVSKATQIRNRVEAMISQATDNNRLERLEFYFISFGYFCALSDGRYVPAEVGAVRYSLEGGILDTFHMLINPGPLPAGKRLDAKQHSENFHQLPLPPVALGEQDFDMIAHRLGMFLHSSDKNKTSENPLPLLFTDRGDIPHVESILKDILNVQATGMEVVVCPLSEMFFLLKKSVLYYSLSLPEGFPSESIPQILLDRDIYSYTPKISCEFHEQQGNGTYCALSRCVRWAYVVSDSCCLDLHIEMIPGKHIPTDCISLLDVLSTKDDSVSVLSSGNDAICGQTTDRSSDRHSNLRENEGSETYPSSSSHASAFGGDYIDLESSASRTMEDRFKIRDDPTAQQLPTAGPGSMYSRGLIHPVLGLGRGRRVAYDNTPPVVSNRKSFK